MSDMNKALVVFGILLLIVGVVVGVVVAFLAESGVIITLWLLNPFSDAIILVIQTAVTITFMVVGGILILRGIKKS